MAVGFLIVAAPRTLITIVVVIVTPIMLVLGRLTKGAVIAFVPPRLFGRDVVAVVGRIILISIRLVTRTGRWRRLLHGRQFFF